MVDLIRHSGRAADSDVGIIQLIVLRVVNVVFRPGACPLDHHRDLKGSAVIHVHIDLFRIFLLHCEHIAQIRRCGNGRRQSNALAGFIDVAQIQLDGDVAAVQLVQILPGAVKGHGNVLCGHVGDHQVPFAEDRFTGGHHRDVIEGIFVLHTDIAHHVQPEAKGHHNGQQDGIQFIFVHSHPPSPYW